MNKLKSRKLWAWGIWTIITILALFLAKEHISIIIPWYGGVTTLYIGGQAAVDVMEKFRGKDE